MRQDACLLIATPKQGSGEKGRKGEGESKARNKVVKEKAKASICVDSCKRAFTCMKTPTTTKSKKCGLGL